MKKFATSEIAGKYLIELFDEIGDGWLNTKFDAASYLDDLIGLVLLNRPPVEAVERLATEVFYCIQVRGDEWADEHMFSDKFRSLIEIVLDRNIYLPRDIQRFHDGLYQTAWPYSDLSDELIRETATPRTNELLRMIDALGSHLHVKTLAMPLVPIIPNLGRFLRQVGPAQG